MSAYLHRVNTIKEVPLIDSVILYDLTGGIFYVKKSQYPDFAYQWCLQTAFEPYTMDLASAESHSLVFDLDFKRDQGVPASGLFSSILSVIHSTLKMLFLTNVEHFTYIVATRAGGQGCHVHCPEFTVAHDDYILLCEYLQTRLACSIPGHGRYELDILQNAMLSGAAKPNTAPYTPLLMVYVDEKQTHSIQFNPPATVSEFRDLNQRFKRMKANNNSYFRKFLFLEPAQIENILRHFMMPLATPYPPFRKLSYATVIGNATESHPFEDIASFTYKNRPEIGTIHKGKQLLFDGSHSLKAFHFLRFNSFLLDTVETNNAALRAWYRRYADQSTTAVSTHPVFESVNQSLREHNTKFLDDPNPIQTIMEYKEGFYFLPMFYALCSHLKISSVQMVAHLKGMLGKDFFPLLDRMEQVNPQHMQITLKDFTEDTIYYCGQNLNDRTKKNRDKLKQIVDDSKRAILCCSSLTQLETLFRRLQENHFPIHVLALCNSLRKPGPYLWNCLAESWQELTEKEKDSHLQNLWYTIKSFLRDYRKAGGVGGPDDDTLRSFCISTLHSTITSDTNLERKSIQMDRHKWFLRLKDGLLDILTGHIGGTVPEMFLSDRRMGIDLSRHDMMVLYHRSPDLEMLYEHMTRKSFFLKYLKACFTDRTDDVFDTLHELIQEDLPRIAHDPHALSMMHFYCHLCKYTAFEHDLMMYVCDVLASIFIATNYERKFFVCKGETSNGKSKLFEILGRVFGSYYHSIQADNLKPGSSSSHATPDLASTMFNCRIVTSEELDGKLNENRVKQLTGNSAVVFRNLYEASQGGIPTAKIFASTNNVPDCKGTEAFADRATAIPFLSKFVKDPPATTSEQVKWNRYGKDEYALEQSYMGCFLILIYHLKKHMSLRDGLLHYRAEPPSVVEYTELYLENTDVYNQFKTHMDVQLSEGTITMMSDLRSAVRDFKKSCKDNTISETHLIMKFEDEFSRYRRSDVCSGAARYTSLTRDRSERLEWDAGPSRPKKPRTAPETTVVFYENVAIRNLKRTYDN